MQYRKEIDGLRAIAVIPVILFHAGFPGFSGGYIGVDIFFVISGYLITSIILEEKKQNKFSIVNFYERRARRILPALSVVLIVTTIGAYVFMPAYLLQEYSQSLVSVVTFTSNIFFYFKTDYFDSAAEEKPLLHTWSLAIEEQYYVFFPIIVGFIWPFGKKILVYFIVLIAILSLFFAQLMSLNNKIDANFYFIFSRAWELLLGAIIVFILSQPFFLVRWQRELAGIFGLLMIVVSIVVFNDKTPFPSFYTLLPTLGACLIIVFSNAETYVGRILSNRIFVSVGLMSYSLYLWHQPLFAFLRLKSIGTPSDYLFVVAILFTYGLAFLTWRYVETPFRYKEKFSRVSVFQWSGISILVFLSIGLIGWFFKGFESRFGQSIYADSIKFSPKRNDCHTRGENYLRPSEACKYFGENITWASFGDSHTVEPAYALAKRLEHKNEGLIHLSFSGCPPALLFNTKLPLGCVKWINESVVFLEQNKSIKNILIGFRYSSFLFGDQLDSYPGLPNDNPALNFINIDHPLSAEEARNIYWESFESIISRLAKSGKNIYVLYPVPELPVDIHKAVAPYSIFGTSAMLDLQKATSIEYYMVRNNFIIKKLDSLPYGKNLHAIKPFEIICDGKFCPAVKGNNALYFDDDHLSISGAELIAERINIGN